MERSTCPTRLKCNPIESELEINKGQCGGWNAVGNTAAFRFVHKFTGYSESRLAIDTRNSGLDFSEGSIS
jgi:hypothetical protein